MPDTNNDPSVSRGGSHRYRIVDTVTEGVYVLVSPQPKTGAQIDEVVASVVRDEGRVRAGRVRMILI